MKLFKRIVSMLLVVLLILSATACSKNNGDDSSDFEWVYESEVVITQKDENNSDGDNSNSTTSDKSSNVSSGSIAGQSLEKKYKNLKGRKIRVVGWWDPTPAGTEDYKLIVDVEKKFNCDFVEVKLTDYKQLYTSILAGDPICDLFVPRDTHILNMANKNMLTPLDTLNSDGFNVNDSIWNPTCRAECTLNGHVYGLSAKYQLRNALAYNKDMFKTNNWPDLYELSSKGKLTWDVIYDIITKAAKVDAGGNVTRFGLGPIYSLTSLANLLMNSNGVKVISRQGDTKNLKSQISSAAATEALNTLRKWNRNPGYLYDTTKYSWSSSANLFVEGKMAMVVTDELGSTMKNADFDIGLVMFPHGPSAKKDVAYYTATGTPVVMPKGVKNPEDVMLFWSVREAYILQNKKSTIYDSFPDASVKATYEKYKQALLSLNYVYDFAGDAGIDSNSGIYEDVAAGTKTPQEALQSIQQIVGGKINDFWK